MTPTYTDPFEELANLRRQLFRLMDAATVGGGKPSGGSEPPNGGNAPQGEWTPPADVSVTPTEVVIALEVAGMAREQISVAVEGQTLTITGHRDRPGNGEKVLHSEWAFGEFSRSFSLGWDVDADRVQASLRDGVLEVKIGRKLDE